MDFICKIVHNKDSSRELPNNSQINKMHNKQAKLRMDHSKVNNNNLNSRQITNKLQITLNRQTSQITNNMA